MQVLQKAATMLTQKNGTQHTGGEEIKYCGKIMKAFH
jgi:hypothetical protein